MLRATLAYVVPRAVVLIPTAWLFAYLAPTSCFTPGTRTGLYDHLNSAAEKIGRALTRPY